MRFVKLREFQHHLSDYLKQLPITLTSRDKPVADVIPHVEKSKEKKEKFTPKWADNIDA